MERMKFCSASFNARCSLNVRHKLSYVIFKISTLVTDETLICSFKGCGVGFRVYCDSTSSLKNIFLRVILSFQKNDSIDNTSKPCFKEWDTTGFLVLQIKIAIFAVFKHPWTGFNLFEIKIWALLTSEHSVPFFLRFWIFELSSDGKYFMVFSKGFVLVNKANYVFLDFEFKYLLLFVRVNAYWTKPDVSSFYPL